MSNQNKPPKYALKKGARLLQGKYTITQYLGEGGFGITYLAYDKQLDQTVVVKEFYMTDKSFAFERQGTKVITSQEGSEVMEKSQKLFKQEATIAKKFSWHPHIVNMHALFSENNTWYFVLEYAKDGNLQEYVQRKGGKLAIYETMEVVRQVGMALHALHQDNVTHRDIKPANIVKNGDNFIIIDFGIAKDESGQQTQISSIMAKTVGYSPPEQVDKSVVKQPSMDIYALGATAYMMLTGQVPTPAEVRQSRLFADGVDDLAEPKALNSSVPDNINTAIMKAMALNRQARYQSIPEMFADLNLPTDMMAPPRNAPVETLILDKSGTPISTPNPQISSDSTSVFQEVTPTKKPEKRKNRTALWLTIATCLLLGVGIAFWQPWVMPTKNEETKKEKKGLSEEDAKEANRKALEDIITDEKTIDKENEKSKDEKSNTTPPSIKGYEDTKIDKTNPPQPQPPIKREEIKPIDKPSGNQGVLSSFTASYQKKNKVQVTFCTPASMSGFTFSIHGAAITSQKQEQIINASACAYPNKFLLEYNANFRKGDNCQVQVYHQNRLIGTVLFIHNP